MLSLALLLIVVVVNKYSIESAIPKKIYCSLRCKDAVALDLHNRQGHRRSTMAVSIETFNYFGIATERKNIYFYRHLQ